MTVALSKLVVLLLPLSTYNTNNTRTHTITPNFKPPLEQLVELVLEVVCAAGDFRIPVVLTADLNDAIIGIVGNWRRQSSKGRVWDFRVFIRGKQIRQQPPV